MAPSSSCRRLLIIPPPIATSLFFFFFSTVTFIFFLTVLIPPKSGGVLVSVEESKKMIGSKPPACENKCMNCRPCMATLVIPNNQGRGRRRSKTKDFNLKSSQINGDQEHENYYLLSWRCRCGNKLFQP